MLINDTSTNSKELTETQIRQKVEQLEAHLNTGEATVRDAESLIELRRNLWVIESARYGAGS